MRILIIHNRYQDPGGEDVVVQQEADLLSKSAEVRTLIFQNHKGLRGFFQFLRYPFNFGTSRRIVNEIQSFNPDLIHLHNIHYAIGPTAISSIHRLGLPIVMTLHNYRLLCPTATLYHQGGLFTDSLTRSFPWAAVKKGAHEGSVLKTFWIAFTYFLHKTLGTWKKVDNYIALTQFAKDQISQSSIGIALQKVSVKPNFIALPPAVKDIAITNRKAEYLFVGRLTAEKGIYTLINAFKTSKKPLTIVGDGPLRAFVEENCRVSSNLNYLGPKTSDEVRELMVTANALIFPSEWYEGMPMTLIEAFSTGTTVIASNLGAMQEMIKEGEWGFLFDAGNASSLNEAIARWEKLDASTQEQLRINAKNRYEQAYTPEINRQKLLDLYSALLK